MQVLETLVAAAALALTFSTPALSQPTVPPVADMVSLSGPRFGGTFLSDGVVKKLKTDDGLTVAPFISQFGWQFEKQFYGGVGGPTAVTEAVVLLGGLEQGVALPSVSWLVGVRTKNGTEFGVGPNINPVGAALVVSGGMTFRAGVLNVPVNVAVVPSKAGVRVSVLSGFNLRRR
jgi:hypothetical protein